MHKEQEELSTRTTSTSMVAGLDNLSQYSSSPLIERMPEPPYHPRHAAAYSGYCKADRLNQGRGEADETTTYIIAFARVVQHRPRASKLIYL